MVVDNFTVAVTCNSQPFTEGSIGPYDVYRINATAPRTYGSLDYYFSTC